MTGAARDRIALIVMAKAPVPGRVKTRLCPPASPSQAATVAEAALADTLHAALQAPVDRRVLVLEGAVSAWVPSTFEVIPQRGSGLDERLSHAFEDVDCPAFLIGMDTPQVTASLIAHASGLLARSGSDAVLGWAADGGWWGIGLRRPDPAVFLGIRMSTSGTGKAQAARLDALGLRWERLPVLRDVDTFADAMAVAATIPHTRFAAAVDEIRRAIVSRVTPPKHGRTAQRVQVVRT